ALTTADVVIVKELGLGLALAIGLDATLIRSLLVPATMRVLGDWNSWPAGGTGAQVETRARRRLTGTGVPEPREARMSESESLTLDPAPAESPLAGVVREDV